MEFTRCVYLMTTLALYIFSHHIEAVEFDGPTEALINSICNKNEDYEFCNKIIHERLKIPTANLKELTHLIIMLSLEHASDTYIFIGNILRKLPDPDKMTGLVTCLAVYNKETDIFLNVSIEFSRKEYKRMVINILSTTKILKDCRTNFPIPPNKKNPLIKKNKVMRILIDMSAASGDLLEKEEASLLSSVVTSFEFAQY